LTATSSAATDSSWGADLTIITVSGFAYLPGVYALFNSAIENGFAGNVRLFLDQDVDESLVVKHRQLQVEKLPPLFADEDYSYYPKRLAAFSILTPGKYIYLDADFIVERPCGHLLDPIDDGLLVSTEPVMQHNRHDVIVYHQCKITGINFSELASFPYVNAGLLGFSLERDRDFTSELTDLSLQHLKGVLHTFQHPYFPHLDQDLLNLLVRKYLARGRTITSISPRILEFSNYSKLFRDRPFPHTKQSGLQPADQIKYLIHGASLRRPWLKPAKTKSLKAKLAFKLEGTGFRAVYAKPLPYERAWAYYACSEKRPIPVSSWASKHDFNAHLSPAWMAAYGVEE
jgi:hypothetical protein